MMRTHEKERVWPLQARHRPYRPGLCSMDEKSSSLPWDTEREGLPAKKNVCSIKQKSLILFMGHMEKAGAG